MSCQVITTIERTEYIGNSLSIINSNFNNLNFEICRQQTAIDSINLSAQNLNTDILSISSVLVPGAAQAYVKFNGTRDETNTVSTFFTNRRIYKEFNVLSVYRLRIGDYRVTFRQPFTNSNYLAIASNSETNNPQTNTFGWATPYLFANSFVDVRISNQVDPQHVSVLVY